MKLLDLLFERSTRRVADTTSRRKLLSRMGSLMVAGAALPLLLPRNLRKPVTRVIRTAATTGATAPSTAFCAAAAVVR
jgi:hypothetical protein